jgi:hypothetical protein
MAARSIAISEVKTKKELKSFLHFPGQIYRGNPYWVPPLLKEHALLFSPQESLSAPCRDLSPGTGQRGSVGGDVLDPGRQSPHAEGVRGVGGEDI